MMNLSIVPLHILGSCGKIIGHRKLDLVELIFFPTNTAQNENGHVVYFYCSELPLTKSNQDSPFHSQELSPPFPQPNLSLFPQFLVWLLEISRKSIAYSVAAFLFISTDTTHYEFSDGSSEVELRLELGEEGISPKEIFIDANENSLVIKVQNGQFLRTLLDTNKLYGMIKPSETIWYIDEDQLVVNFKKQDPELKWPDIMESWESLTAGVAQLLKGTSIYLVGESTEINHKIARELAVGLGYTPLNTKEILESYSKETIDLWVASQGCDTVAEAESAILESLSSHARAVVSTLGGKHGAAGRPNKWQHLFAGFTIWLSLSEATDEKSAKEEARRHFQNGVQGYSNAEVVVKLRGWDANHSKAVAQASLSALKHLILSDRNLPGKKSLYVRLGCRGDWPDIKPPGDQSTGSDASSPVL